MEGLKQRVLRFIQDEGLTGSGETLLVGVSGGPDSVCLLHILNQLRETIGVDLNVAHLNHMLRGVDSDGDANYVSHLSSNLGIPATVERADVSAYREEHRLSVEEAAREVRYAFFARVARDIGAKRVALGHTRDDQAETILMNLLRGTGLTGLRGMLPATPFHMADGVGLEVIRPLLEVTREQTEGYCRQFSLNPRVDLSNLSLDHTRNRVRHELIPALRRYNVNIDAALIRTAEAAADAMSLLDREVSGLWDRVVIEQPNGLLIDSEALLSYHPAIQRHLLRRAVLEILGDLVDIQAVHVDKMEQALSKPAGRRITLPRGLSVSVGYRTCLLSNGGLDACPFSTIENQHRIAVPGETEIPGWLVRTSVAPAAGEKVEGYAAHLDLDSVGEDLTVRARRPGDRFQPLGMSGTKSLQDFMVDAKIPRSWRSRIPLVCSPESIVWVVGWRIAERAKVTADTRQTLQLEFERV
jgi:tRNA(Ile)-lysidine synthase